MANVNKIDGEIHGHLQVQKYLQLKTQIKYPKEYPCQIKKRTSVTPENIFLMYIVDYVIRLLDFFAKVLRNYIGNTYSTEKTLIDEHRRAFHAFSRKNYFRECALSLENIRKQYGDEFPANLLNLIKIRAAKGKIRNYQSYEKIFDWYWKYKQGTIEFDLLKTLRILRYSDDFCNRLFELWCLYSIKETFIKEFGMTLISERNAFFSVAVPIMKEINVNIRRLSAHTTIMKYDELINTRQKILGIGYLNLFYQLLDHR